MTSSFAGALLLLSLLPLPAQQIDPKTLANGALEDRAVATYRQGEFVEALPLYEELVKRSTKSMADWEELSMCLAAAARINPDPKQGALQWARAADAAKHAKELGDTSQIETYLLDMTTEPLFQLKDLPGEAGKMLAAAEADFTKGDIDSALLKYAQASALDPKMYEAPLFAGDVEYRLHNSTQAGVWFAKAIAIDPNRETAYRYWGDALRAAGKDNEAREKLVEAMAAEPYNKNSANGLINWAQANGYSLRWPDIKLPPAPTETEKDGKPQTNIVIDPSLPENSSAAWLVYSMTRVTFRADDFSKAYPAEKTYRHSLQEEVKALNAALDTYNEVQAQKKKKKKEKPDPGLDTLLKIRSEGLLEPWIFFCDADNGIAQDYPAYRDAHRDLVRKFLNEYLIHRGITSPS